MGDVSYLCYVPSIVGLRLIPNDAILTFAYIVVKVAELIGYEQCGLEPLCGASGAEVASLRA